MDDEDDAPPMLVPVDGKEDGEQEEAIPELVETGDAEADDEIARVKKRRVPITIITGYLGAGKTTLLNYILTARHGKKIAVILNEFGNTTDIERSLTVSENDSTAEEWLDLANGCICCSVKDSGVNAIESLMERRGSFFDYILLETTGLADPGNLAPLFWVDEGLGSTIYLDGIVAVVDAVNLGKSLDEPVGEERVPDHDHESEGDGNSETADSTQDTKKKKSPHLSIAHLQISHADVILLNKTDLVSPASRLEAIESRIRSINSLAKLTRTSHSVVPALEGQILDLHAYDSVTAENLSFADKGHSHLDPAIGTLQLRFPALRAGDQGEDEGGLERLDAWLRAVLWDCALPRRRDVVGWEVHRCKGRIPMKRRDGGVRVKILQGVREIFEMTDSLAEDESSEKNGEVGEEGKIVFIGKNIHGEEMRLAFQESLDASLFADAEKEQ